MRILIKDNQKYFNRLHVIIDAAVITISYLLAWVCKFILLRDPLGLTFVQYCYALIGIVPLYLVLYLAFNLYTPKRVQGRRLEAGNIIKANTFGLLVIMGLLSIPLNYYISYPISWIVTGAVHILFFLYVRKKAFALVQANSHVAAEGRHPAAKA